MSTPPLPLWTTSDSEAQFSPPSECAVKASKFERKIYIRNAIEYVAGALVLLLFGAASIGAFYNGEGLIGASLFTIVLGTIVVMVQLKRRGSNLGRRPEDDCVSHLRRQYQRQYEALRTVPIWYIGPFLPGLVGFYLAVTARVAEHIGWAEAVSGIAGPASISFGLIGVIMLANWIGARALKRRIDELDALSG